jgi:hypothetical protein
MANADRARGLQPYEEVKRESPYVAGGTVYPGDAVKLDNSGRIVVAAASDALQGVAAHYATSGNPVMVWDHPDQKFVAQAATGVSIAQTDMGLNADIVANSPDSTYRQSRHEIDGSSIATTPATLQLRLLAISPAIDNAAGDMAKVVCVINSHQLKAGTAGV